MKVNFAEMCIYAHPEDSTERGSNVDAFGEKRNMVHFRHPDVDYCLDDDVD